MLQAAATPDRTRIGERGNHRIKWAGRQSVREAWCVTMFFAVHAGLVRVVQYCGGRHAHAFKMETGMSEKSLSLVSSILEQINLSDIARVAGNTAVGAAVCLVLQVSCTCVQACCACCVFSCFALLGSVPEIHSC